MTRQQIRVKACELAAQCLEGQVALEGNVGARIMSLVIFFEEYITVGSTKTEEKMRLLHRRKVKNLRVIAGGGL